MTLTILPPSSHQFGLRPSLATDIDEARLAEIDERAHRACVDVLPSLFNEPDDFLAELAGLPEIARVLRGTGP